MPINNPERTLFTESEEEQINRNAPLAVRLRPVTIDEFVGQEHFAGPGKLLRRMLDADKFTSVIFYGPPGVGKTTLAHIIARHTKSHMKYISAPAAGTKDIREAISHAKDRLLTGHGRTLLFIDEIHRFNRAQQDVLLDDVERGIVILIGATTENPYFSVNSPLISRSTVFQFEPLSTQDILSLLNRAITDKEKGLGNLDIDAEKQALEFIAQICDGDARRALTALETAVLSQKSAIKTGETIQITTQIAKESMQKKSIQYDGQGDSHYDLASALQKSMRGSDPDAAVYWLARMIAGGEDLRFIARRVAICAAEDVGNADPVATILAASAVQIAEFVGFPEAQLPLAQAVIYIACAPKSNACANAVWNAVSDVRNSRTVPVPAHLRDSHYKGAAKLGHGLDYKYPHSYPGGYVEQDYMGQANTKKYYNPTNRGREKTINEYLQKLQTMLKEGFDKTGREE